MLQAATLRAPARILGCSIASVTMERALDWCLATCATTQRARIVLTANASHLVDLQDDDALRQAADAADLVVADGMSLVWASYLLGTPVPERVAGIDLLTNLLAEAPQRRLRVFLLGAKPAVIERFVAWCRETYPGLDIAGWRHGYFTADQHGEVVREIAASGADMLFVAMPSPFKDIWCERHRDALGVKLIMGVGGAFDVLAGLVPRAPRWMQAAGLEWAWRLGQEPRRLWKRYLVGNCRFVWLIVASAMPRRDRQRENLAIRSSGIGSTKGD